jgi:hypothetical protein
MRQIFTIVALLYFTVRTLADHAPEVPLPALETIIKNAVEHSKKEPENDRLFQQRYEFIRTKVTEYRNGDGELTKREAKASTNHVHAVTVARPKPKPTVTTPKAEAKKSDRIDKKDILLNEDLFSRFQFHLIGRNQIAGRSVLVLDFKPANKKLPNNNFKDRFINIAAGRVWMDEEDFALAKADLHLTEKVNFIGGIVGAVAGFRCTLDRERTKDGLWFTRAMDWHLEARVALAHRTIDYHEEKTGVRNKAAHRANGSFPSRQ